MTVTIRQASDEDVGTLASLQRTVRRVFEIDHVAVSSGHRKMGVARALSSHVLEDARSRHVRDVELSSWFFTTEARAAFRAFGFEPTVVRFGRASF